MNTKIKEKIDENILKLIFLLWDRWRIIVERIGQWRNMTVVKFDFDNEFYFEGQERI